MIRREVLAERLVPLGECDDDAIGIRSGVARSSWRQCTPPGSMTIGKRYGQRAGQRRAKQHLPHRLDRHVEACERGDAASPRPGGVDDHGRVDRARPTARLHAA